MRPLLAFCVLALTASWAVSRGTGALYLNELTHAFARLALGGLLASFLLHETAHLLSLKRCSGVRTVVLSTTALRFSITPVGLMSSRQIAVTAAVGPLSCVLAGTALLQFDGALAAVYLAHVLQLLPIFGDGRALILARRGWRLTDEGYVTPGDGRR